MHPKDFPFEAGRLLREKRLERGVSQLQLADHAGVHASVVQRAENGRDARLSTWHNLFGALGHDLRLTLEEPDDEYASFIVEEGERGRATARAARGRPAHGEAPLLSAGLLVPNLVLRFEGGVDRRERIKLTPRN